MAQTHVRLPHNSLISLNQAFLMRTLTTIVCDVPVDLDLDGAMIKESVEELT